jgi:hypothetical protein
MRENNGYDNMEQLQLPIVIFIMALFLVAGFTVKKIDHEYFSIPQMLANFHEWMLWKLLPGW